MGLVGTKSFVLTDAPTWVPVFRLSSVAVRARARKSSFLVKVLTLRYRPLLVRIFDTNLKL